MRPFLLPLAALALGACASSGTSAPPPAAAVAPPSDGCPSIRADTLG